MPDRKPVLPQFDLGDLEQVVPDYEHNSKLATAGAAIATSTTYLKWYDVAYRDAPIPHDEDREAHKFLLAEMYSGKLKVDRELGFVVHHRCTNAYVLYVCTWRNENELWETIYQRGLEEGSKFTVIERQAKTPTYCVWVLGVVNHEMQAWTRYLYTGRDEEAKRAYVRDQMSGTV